MNIVKEIEGLMMYRGEMPEEGKLREILERYSTEENERLKEEVKHWKSNHADILKQYNNHRKRPDIKTYQLEEQLKKAVDIVRIYNENIAKTDMATEFLESLEK